jgi:hypothetical protein
MAHMVVFRSNEGKPGYHHAEGLDEAVRFVEHLRNQEQVTEARIFRLQEVPIEFKTYYRVEVAAGGPGEERNGDGVEEQVDEDVPEPVASEAPGGRFRFSRT